MRVPGMNLPVTDGYMRAISAGPSEPLAAVTRGAIGVSFMTPGTAAFRATRKRYGADDPNAGGYNLSQIDWDKETGTCTVGSLEPTHDGWLGEDCGGGQGCSCG